MIRGIESARRRGHGSHIAGHSTRSISAPRSALKGVLTAALLLGSLPAAAEAQPGTSPPAPAAQPVDAFRQQADRLAVQRCANLFSAIGQTATAGSTYAVQVHANRENPDAHAVQGVVGITYDTPEIRGQAAGVVLAAPVGNACEGQLVRVAPFQQPCDEVVGLLPAGSTGAATLAGVPLYNLGGNQGQALLVTSGNSCVVVTVAQMATIQE
jgi:hypothetical protein